MLDELRSSLLIEDPAFDLCPGYHPKEHGRKSSDETVNEATALFPDGGAKKSDFTQSLCGSDLVHVDAMITAIIFYTCCFCRTRRK